MSASATIWEGAEALRPFLVPLDNLAPFPGNPRRGDVAQLRGSLRRFGQVLPALADPALEDGDLVRIIARHHLALAATEEGWTHIAVIPHEFADETEARAYLLADNRLGDSQQQRQQFEVWLKIVQKERDTGGISETCYEALRLAAQQLNLG